MEDAVKLLNSVVQSDPNFMYGEIQMLLGDRMFSNTHKDYATALSHYQDASESMPHSVEVYEK